MNNTPISIVLADDEHLIRGALAALLDLEDDFQLVAEVDNGTDALAAAREHSPTVCVLDLEMPPTDGVDAATSILRDVDTHVVMVTRHARPGVLRRALAAGVEGFVPKSTPSGKLAEVIRTVAGGARYVDPDIAASALTGTDCPLTERELHVLRASTEHDTLAQTAVTLHLAPGTVRNYVSAAMAKLGASSRQQAAHKAWEEGWI